MRGAASVEAANANEANERVAVVSNDFMVIVLKLKLMSKFK